MAIDRPIRRSAAHEAMLGVWSFCRHGFVPVPLIVGGYKPGTVGGATHVAGKYSGIDPTLIKVTEPLPHVRTNIVKTVYRDTAMGPLDFGSTGNCKIASAFNASLGPKVIVCVSSLEAR